MDQNITMLVGNEYVGFKAFTVSNGQSETGIDFVVLTGVIAVGVCVVLALAFILKKK